MHSIVRSSWSLICLENPRAPLIVIFPPILFAGHMTMPSIVSVKDLNCVTASLSMVSMNVSAFLFLINEATALSLERMRVALSTTVFKQLLGAYSKSKYLPHGNFLLWYSRSVGLYLSESL